MIVVRLNDDGVDCLWLGTSGWSSMYDTFIGAAYLCLQYKPVQVLDSPVGLAWHTQGMH